MKTKLQNLLLLAVPALALGACYVREVRPEPPGCPYGAVWVEGFRDPYGVWHRGHWRCR